MKNLTKFVVVGSLLSCAAAQAGGLYLYETSTTDIGLASAGMAARAHDASVMAANPAGLSNVAGQSFSGHLISLYGDATLDTIDGGDAGNIIGYVPLGSAFYSQQVNDKWTLGIGMYGNYGLGLEYDQLFNRIDIPNAITQAVTVQPSASYRINEQWSVGAALGIHYGILDMDVKVDGTSLAGGIEDTDVQVNGRVGALYELNSGTRLGLSYSSEAEFDFADKDLTTSAVLPQQIVFSAYHELNDKLALMGNLNWQDWSAYDTLMGVETQDTYQVAIGAQYKINSKVTWNAGFAFDTSMYADQSNGDLTIPAGKSYRLGTGFDYKIDEASSVSVAFEAMLIDSSEIKLAGIPVANFDDPALYFLSVGYNWKNQ
ncbi:TPA: OmpP1/FadL family transporter [Vibrio harveyi]